MKSYFTQQYINVIKVDSTILRLRQAQFRIYF